MLLILNANNVICELSLIRQWDKKNMKNGPMPKNRKNVKSSSIKVRKPLLNA